MHDMVTSAYLLGALILGATNTAALLADKRASGVRPYCATYMAIGNAWLAYNFASLGQPGAAVMSGAFCMLNAANAALIVHYRAKEVQMNVVKSASTTRLAVPGPSSQRSARFHSHALSA